MKVVAEEIFLLANQPDTVFHLQKSNKNRVSTLKIHMKILDLPKTKLPLKVRTPQIFHTDTGHFF